MNRKIPILAYHKVDEHALTKFWVDTVSFDIQMSALRRRGYEAVRLEDLWLAAHGCLELPEKPVCITFDDGYENFFSRAFPVLRKHGFIATVFLPTAYIGTDSRSSNSWDRSPDERAYRAGHMLWSEVLQLKEYGMEFGAHTKTHQDLDLLFRSEPELAMAEIIESRDELSQKLSVSGLFLSYPYRSCNRDIELIARRAGFHGAVIMNNRLFDITCGNWFQMDRIPVFSGKAGRSADEISKDFLALLGEK